ncbi:MAG: PEP-CTERM sorting domain-containing protein [Planctomycetota bacterium]
MKHIAFAAAIAMVAGAASADVYNDASGRAIAPGVGGDMHPFFDDQGFSHLDISSVEITNDSQWLYIRVDLVGDIDATNWGKYAIGIDTGNSVGDNSNGWGRNIDWGRNINFWSATWADDNGSGFGGEFYGYDDGGGAWGLIDATYAASTDIAGDDSTHGAAQSWRLSLSALGIGIGDTIEFDVVSTGGGADPGVDHLSRSGAGDFATTEWGVTSTAGTFLSYTLVPTPGAIAVLGLGGLATGRRRR